MHLLSDNPEIAVQASTNALVELPIINQRDLGPQAATIVSTPHIKFRVVAMQPQRLWCWRYLSSPKIICRRKSRPGGRLSDVHINPLLCDEVHLVH